MSIQTEHLYIVRLAVEATGVDPYDAVHRALESVPLSALGSFTVSVERVPDAAPSGADSDRHSPVDEVGHAWGGNDHKEDLRYHGEFLGVASSKVVSGKDR